MTEQTTAVIWSINRCPYCEQAKKILTTQNIPYEERNIQNGDWVKADLAKALNVEPDSRILVPQIFINDKYIGGCDKLIDYFVNMENK